MAMRPLWRPMEGTAAGEGSGTWSSAPSEVGGSGVEAEKREVSELPRKLEERNWERGAWDRTGRKEEVKTERGKQAKQDVGNPTKQEGKARATGERGRKLKEQRRAGWMGRKQERQERGSQEEERRTWEKKPRPTRGT